MAHKYRFIDLQGKVTLTAIANHAYRPDCQLAYRMIRNPQHDYKKGVATHLSNLIMAHHQERIQHVGMVLHINLHTFFSSSHLFLGRAKKIIMIALQLRMVTHIEFQA